jgi:uncharacterized phage protein gp47/JayE
MSPTTYSPPTIGPSGLLRSNYTAILNYLTGQYTATFGSNVYLGPDSSDFQWIAILALQAYDYQMACQVVYLSFNPLTAFGASLDLLGVLIGTARNGASYSTVAVTLSGTAGTIITNGVVQDVNQNFWTISGSWTIGSGGTVIATAIAQQLGTISVQASQVNVIATPQAGWTGVTNATASTVGQPVEPDSHYRARLLISQAKPSLTERAGTAAALAAVPNVTRSVCYENYLGYTASYGTVNTSSSGDTVTLVSGYPFDSTMAGQLISIAGTSYTVSSVSSATALALTTSPGVQTGVPFFIGGVELGLTSGVLIGPAHSITAVVEGGSSANIAQAIYQNHNPGCDINGTTTVLVSDSNNGTIQLPVSYDILGYTIIYVALNVQGFAGFTSATQAAIQAAVVNYLNNLGIGQTVVWSEVIASAATVNPNAEQPLFSIHASGSIIGQQEASTTATLSTSSATITVASGTGTANGQTVVGAGIPPSTTVSSGGGTTSIVLSATPTVAGTLVPVSFFATGTSDIAIAYNKAPGGDAANTLIALVS